MANPEHLALLKHGVNEWNHWRRANPHIIPDLIAAKLAHADLRRVDFQGANLMSADLRGADLREALLFGASLHGADLFDARIELPAEFVEFLRQRTGFDESTIESMCDVDIQQFVIATNRPMIVPDAPPAKPTSDVPMGAPAAFGDPQRTQRVLFSLIDTVRAPFCEGIWREFQRARLFCSCFISYSHTDERFATMLHDSLKERGVTCWLDQKQLLPGQDIYDEVDRGIRLRDKMLLCCSEASLNSWWVDNELGTALEEEQRLTRERGHKVQTVIPLNLDGYLFSDAWKSGYRAQFRRRLAADFTGWSNEEGKFEREFDKLLWALRADRTA